MAGDSNKGKENSISSSDRLKNEDWNETLGLTLWKEIMVQLRQTHNDIWNGVRFVLTVNGIVFAGLATLISAVETSRLTLAVSAGVLLVLIGAAFTVVAWLILDGHRRYYLETLAKKTLLEQEIGLYDITISKENFSLPWQVEKQYVKDVKEDPSKWRSERLRKGKITPYLYGIYCAILGIYVGLVIGFVLFLLKLMPPWGLVLLLFVSVAIVLVKRTLNHRRIPGDMRPFEPVIRRPSIDPGDS